MFAEDMERGLTVQSWIAEIGTHRKRHLRQKKKYFSQIFVTFFYSCFLTGSVKCGKGNTELWLQY